MDIARLQGSFLSSFLSFFFFCNGKLSFFIKFYRFFCCGNREWIALIGMNVDSTY